MLELEEQLRRYGDAIGRSLAHGDDRDDAGGPDVAPEPPPGHRRRRQRLLATLAAAAVLLLAAGALAVIGDDEAGDDQVDLATDAGLEPAPQRLILLDGRRELWRELLPNGKPVPLELAGLDPHGAPRPLPGGGHVVVGIHPVEEPPPEGFNEFTDLTYGVAVVGANGTVTSERDIEPSTLVGVTSTEAILVRQPRDDSGQPSGPVSILTHNLATGEERVVRPNLPFDPDLMVSAGWAIVADDLVAVEASQLTEPTGDDSRVIVPGSKECTLSVTDLATGELTEQPLALECSMVRGLQASPDGSQAAVAYERAPDDEHLPEVRLAVIDLPNGAVRQDQLLGHNIDCRAGGCPPGTQSLDYEGMAWNDSSTLRIATVDLGASFGDLVVQTIPVG